MRRPLSHGGDLINVFAPHVKAKAVRRLVAEHCWDEVRWAIEDHAWRFEQGRGLPSQRRR